MRERRLPEVCQGGALVLDEPGDGVGDDVHLEKIIKEIFFHFEKYG